MVTAPPLSSPSAITSAHTVKGAATAQFESPTRTVPPVVERNWTRTRHLVIGYDFQIGDWVWINNPREGQPNEDEIIGVTRDQLVKIEGTTTIDEQDIIVVVKRSPKNINLANPSLL